MRGLFEQRRSETALEAACLDVETMVSRVAKVVLHATALADRMDADRTGTLPATDASSAQQRQERVRVLREAAEAGRRTICRVGSTPRPAASVRAAGAGRD